MSNKLEGTYIFIVVIIFILITTNIVINAKKKEIKENWIQYRCSPLIMPFAKQFGKDPFKNFKLCMWSIIHKFLNTLLKPIQYIFKLIFKNVKQTGNTINVIRKFINSIRNFIIRYIKNLMGRVENATITLRMMIIKTLEILNKSKGIMEVSKYVFVVLGFMMQVVWKVLRKIIIMVIMFAIGLGLILWLCCTAFGLVVVILAAGAGIAFSCFTSDTLITMDNNEQKKISEIDISEKLYNNNEVIGFIESLGNKENLYEINNTKVSGDHLIYENNICKRVKNSDNSIKIEHPMPIFKLYCLITEKNVIHINNTKFGDYLELKDKDSEIFIKNKLLNYLNKKDNANIISNRTENLSLFGFIENTNIQMNSGFIKNIKLLKVGDILSDHNIVTGIIKIKFIDDIKLYEYNNIIVSGGQIVLDNNIWKCIFQIDNIKPINNNQYKYLYHLNTTHGDIIINDTKFRDFQESSEDKINNILDLHTEKKINCN